MHELLTVATSWLVITALTSAVLRFDERRLRGERALRAFPRSSRMSATFGLALMSPMQTLAIPVHFARTRRSILWTLLGLVIAFLVVFTGGLSAVAVDAMPDLPFPTDPDQQLVASTIIETAIFAVGWLVLARVSPD